MELPLTSREQRFDEGAAVRWREQAKSRDEELRRLELQLGGPEGAPADTETRMLEARDALYRAGSYRQLELVLAGLRGPMPNLSALLWHVEVCGEERTMTVALRVALDGFVAEHVAPLLWLEAQGRPRLPGWLAADVEAGKRGLWRGRSVGAKRLRRERDDRIVELGLQGVAPGVIARRQGLTRQRVQQILEAGS